MNKNMLFCVGIAILGLAGVFSCSLESSEDKPYTDSSSKTGTDNPLRGTAWIYLQWDRVPETKGYVVFYGKTQNYEFSIETTRFFITIFGLDVNTRYYFMIKTKEGQLITSIQNPSTIKPVPYEEGDEDGIWLNSPPWD